jgi:hypothetical protein
MKWTEYATRKDYEAKRDGTTRVGVKWSDAPRGIWAVPEGASAAVNVRRTPGAEVWYRIVAEF